MNLGTYILLYFIAGGFVLGFWAAVIWVAVHFINKF